MVVGAARAGALVLEDVGGGGEAIALFAGGGLADTPSLVGAGGEGAEAHEGGLPLGELLVPEDDFGEVLGLAGVDAGGGVEVELAGHGAMDAVDGDVEGGGDLVGGEGGVLALGFAGRGVLAGGGEAGIGSAVAHVGSPPIGGGVAGLRGRRTYPVRLSSAVVSSDSRYGARMVPPLSSSG